MTWLSIPSKYAPAWECLAKDCEPGSPTWASRLASAATLNGKHTQPPSWQRACKTARWMQHLSGPTFSPSTLQPGLAQWISSLRASRVKICPLLGSAPGSTESAAASSSTSSTSPTLAVRDTSFWRTSAGSLLPPPPLWTKPKGLSTSARPPASWENWPTAGGMRNGSLFQRPTWAPAMGGSDGFAGRGARWDTPDGMPEAPNTGSNRKSQVAGLGNQAKMFASGNWPTPQVGTGENSHGQISGDFRNRMEELLTAPMWMTPNVPNGGRHVPPELVASKGTMEDGTKRTVGLESQTKYWATPKANDAEKRGNVAHRPNMPELVGQATAWPTPKGTDGTKGGPNQAGSKGDMMLPSAQWPTPSASIANDGETPETWHARAALLKEKHGNGNGAGLPLTVAAVQWPTPAARDSKGANSAEHALVTGGGEEAHGPTEQLCRPFFAPGPADAGWAGILREWPNLAPALSVEEWHAAKAAFQASKSGIRGDSDGLAAGPHDSRTARLRACGNGVVALCAAAAVVVLVQRMKEAA